jgi:crotonobetainyl-CoA:carnitine CoA-transferase CaiB-like acyl-CoA transferase
LGEDSAAVLSEFLRMDQQEIERLRRAGVIA